MRTITKEYIVTTDGSEFLQGADARMHEAKTHPENILEGTTPADLLAAITGEDLILREAIETLGKMATKARVESGEKRRKTEVERAPDPVPQPVEEDVYHPDVPAAAAE